MAELLSEIDDYLDADERILWKGQPLLNIHLYSLDWFYVPMSIIFMWFIVKDFILKEIDLLGILFILIGLYLVFGRFIYKYFRKKRTAYYVTDKRVIVFNTSNNTIVHELNINDIKRIHKYTGKIEFGSPTLIQAIGGNTGLDIFQKSTKFEKRVIFDSGSAVPIFYDLMDVAFVYDLVNDIKKNHKKATD